MFLTAFAFIVAVAGLPRGLCTTISGLLLLLRRIEHNRRTLAPILSDKVRVAQLLLEHLLNLVNSSYEESSVFLINADVFLLKDVPRCVNQDL